MLAVMLLLQKQRLTAFFDAMLAMLLQTMLRKPERQLSVWAIANADATRMLLQKNLFFKLTLPLDLLKTTFCHLGEVDSLNSIRMGL